MESKLMEMELGPVQVFKIDLNEKNILVVNFPKNEGSHHGLGLSDMEEALKSWINDSSPLFVLGIYEGVEIRLEKVESE